MNVHLDKRVALACAPEAAWAFLQDVPAVASCMPGARITAKVDDGRYKGTVTVKVGPASLAFKGDLQLQDVDPAARALRLIGKGTDATGTSGASMNLAARVEPADDGTCALVGASDVSMSGKAAAFGARMVNAVAEQILKQFADNVAARLAAAPAGDEPGGAAASQGPASQQPPPRQGPASQGPASKGPAASREPAASRDPPASLAQSASSAQSASPQPAAPPMQPAAPEPVARIELTASGPTPSAPPAAQASASPSAANAAPAHELDGLALLWTLLRNWVRGLFSKKTA